MRIEKERMSSIMNNIPRETLNKLNQEETIEIISQQTASSQKKSSKKNKTEKRLCGAAVPFPTRKKVFEIITSDISVDQKNEPKQDIVIVKEDGISTAYYKCTKTAGENCEYCHLHDNAIKKAEQDNKSGKSNKKTKTAKNYLRDILPRSKDDAERYYLVSEKDPYFEGMASKGCQQKDTGLTIEFKTKKHPILLIWNYKDPRFKKELSEFALNLWMKISSKNASNEDEDSDDDEEEEEVTTNQVPKKRGRPTKKVEETTNSKPVVNQKVSQNITTTNNDVEDSDEDSENESIIEEEDDVDFGSDIDEEPNRKVSNSTTNNSSHKVEVVDSDNESVDEESNVNVDDEEEEDEQVDIINLNDVECAYFPATNAVYEADGDEGRLLGFLTEVKEKDHATIFYKNKYFTTTKELEYNSKKVLHCIENDNVFNMDMTLYGKYIKLNNNSFKINPIKKR